MDLLDKIKKAGVVGAGGAGFPTHVKLDCRVDSLLINAAECEPLLQTDKYILRAYPHAVVNAVSAVADHVAAGKAYIAIKGVNEKETARIRDAISRHRDDRISVFALDNYYPAGDEQMVVYDILGSIVPPSGIPLEIGAVVSNAATMLSISDALADNPVTHKFLTVTGNVRQPKILRVPIGISFRQCIEACGGSDLKRFKVVDGGPMMGKISDGDGLDKHFVTKTTSGIIIIPDENNFISTLEGIDIRKILNRAKSACIQCSFCTDLCPRRMIGHRLRPHMVMRQMAAMDFDAPLEKNKILEEALLCCECGICETFACPMNLAPRQVNIYVKQALAGARYQRDDERPTVSGLREYRKISPVKIMARMGLSELYTRKASEFAELTASAVTISLRQHIGAPAVPVVAAGAEVARGQLIASAESKVSANIHASISGVVTKVGESVEIMGD